MNVGGHRVANEELRAHFEELGLADIATFRASGNVVFSDEKPASAARERKLQEHIEAGLSAALRYDVPTFLRSHAEVLAIAAAAPFAPERVSSSTGKLQVSLLDRSPARGARERVLALACEEDLLSFGERELYWLPSGGLLESSLELDEIDRLLGACTRRTKNTIEQIASKHCGGGADGER